MTEDRPEPPADSEVERRHIQSESQPTRVRQEKLNTIKAGANETDVKPGRHKRGK